MAQRLSLRALNRATLHRQALLERAKGSVADVIGQLAGLQAQHANAPYVALWSRRYGQRIADLTEALTGRRVVKAALMRTTLHLVDAADYRIFDVLSAQPRLATWRPSAQRAGLDLDGLNAEVRSFCQQPRTVAAIEEHMAGLHPGVDAADHIPGGVRNPWFRLATAAGGLVHVPPSGLWKEHGRVSYVDDRRWLGESDRPAPEAALQTAVARFLAAYGPASVADMVKWAGQRQVSAVRHALGTLGDRIVRQVGPDDRELVDLAELEVPDHGIAAPPRFLSRWDSVLIAYEVRDRILPGDYRAAVIKKNGDFLPTFLVDGFVAGLWSVASAENRVDRVDRANRANRATIRLEPFARVPPAERKALEVEAERLIRHVEPEADHHEVAWA